MDSTLFLALAMACAPRVDAGTAHALVAVESGFNPHAIGVVGGTLDRQPRHRAEAVATAQALLAGGWNFSVGLAQINLRNFERLGLDVRTAFEPCLNLTAMQAVLAECFERATPSVGTTTSTRPTAQRALRQALSCYYSGNFITGFEHGYVHRVAAMAARPFPTSLKLKEAP